MDGSRKRRRVELEPEHRDASTSSESSHGAQRTSCLKRSGSGSLCPRCLGIDFDAVFKKKVKGLYGSLVTKLGFFDEEWESSSCNFCQLLADVRPGSSGPFDLYAFPSNMIEIDPKVLHWGHSKVPGLDEEVLLAVIQRRKHQLQFRDETLEMLRETGYISRVMDSIESQSRICARSLKFEIASFDLIESWLEFCKANHKQLCSLPEVEDIPGLKVIDCETRRIVQVMESNFEYLALSYVWGPVPSDLQTYSEGSILPESVPPVIRDAIMVTQKLHYRYLWIDRYCINQDDGDERRAQIQRMGSIYENAQATIIAAAGQDPTYGLPGAGCRDRQKQPTASVGQYTLCSTFPDAKLVISRSKWMSRGWTYQEALLSRRRIIFTVQQVYFECRGMHCNEAIHMPLELIHDIKNERLQSSFHPGFFPHFGSFIGSPKVWEIIGEYCNRQLSRDDDALNGIQGILNQLVAATPPVYHLWGIPIFPPFKWHGGQSRRQLSKVSGSTVHGFANALLWHLKMPARRRVKFPSWSWAGWAGALDFEEHHVTLHSEPIYTGCSCDESEIKISAETNSGKLIPWDSLYQKLVKNEKLDDLSGVLHIQTWTIKLRFIHYPHGIQRDGTLVPQPGFYANSKIGRMETNYDGLLENCTLLSYFFPSRPLDSELTTRLQNEDFVGIVLGCSAEDSGDRVLVVDRSKPIAERLGIIDIRWYTFIRGTPHVSSNRSEIVSDEIVVRHNFCPLDDWQFTKEWRTVRLG